MRIRFDNPFLLAAVGFVATAASLGVDHAGARASHIGSGATSARVDRATDVAG